MLLSTILFGIDVLPSLYMILPDASVGIHTGLQFADGLGPLHAFLNVEEANEGPCEIISLLLVRIKISCPSRIFALVKPAVSLTFLILNLK